MPVPEDEAPPPKDVEAGSLHAAVIYYASGSTRLSRHDRSILNHVATEQAARGATVRVVGHSSRRTPNGDPVAARIANFEVAYHRAQVVAAELIRLGVPADRLLVSSAGDSQPAYSEVTANGEAANRRAEIYIEF